MPQQPRQWPGRAIPRRRTHLPSDAGERMREDPASVTGALTQLFRCNTPEPPHPAALSSRQRAAFTLPWRAWPQACRVSAQGGCCAAREHPPAPLPAREAAGGGVRAARSASSRPAAISSARRRGWVADQCALSPCALVSARRAPSRLNAHSTLKARQSDCSRILARGLMRRPFVSPSLITPSP